MTSRVYFDTNVLIATFESSGSATRYGWAVKLPDAIHLATAIACDCNVFLTDDLRLKLPAGLTRVRLTAHSFDDIARTAH